METPAQVEAEQLSRRIQTARNTILRFAVMLTGLLEILLGGVLILFTLPAFREWSALTLSFRATILLWIIAAPVTLICGVWSLVGLGRHRLPQWIGGSAAISAGAVLIVGVLTHFIPCAGPT